MGCNRAGLANGSDDASAPSLDAGQPIDLSAPDLEAPPDLAPWPDLVVTAALCLNGGNTIYVDGEPDSSAPVIRFFQFDHWIVNPDHPDLDDTFSYEWNDPNDVIIGKWAFLFSSVSLSQPLMVRRYDPARGYPFEGDNTAAFDIVPRDYQCVIPLAETGWFEIEDLAGGPQNGTFTRLTATFEQHCKNKPGALRGCIHFEK